MLFRYRMPPDPPKMRPQQNCQSATALLALAVAALAIATNKLAKR